MTSRVFNGAIEVKGDDSEIPLGLLSLDLADAHCAELAGNNDNLSEKTFKAWLSIPTQNGTLDAGYRLNLKEFTGLFITTEEPPEKLAKGWVGLASKNLISTITHNENGVAVESPLRAWTGTTSNGTASSDHCGFWLGVPGLKGTTGDIKSVSNWTDSEVKFCNNVAHLYCFEVQP